MPTDPRKQSNGDKDVSFSNKTTILFGDADEDDALDEDEALPLSTPIISQASVSTTNTIGAGVLSHYDLLSRIVTPSPYAHHNSGPTSSRFRNAFNRVTAAPNSDVEAWQALMTEVNSCYRNIPNIHAPDSETHEKLDWIESCYGNLLKHFPYASSHYVSIIEILLAQSARFGEENGPSSDYGMDVSRRAMQCEAKAENLLRFTLGVELDGSEVEDSVHFGMCDWAVEVWLLFIKKRERDAKRQAITLPPDDREKHIREVTIKAYDVATIHAGFSHNNHLLWKKYVDYVKAWSSPQNKDHVASQQQMVQLRSVYKRLVVNPMTGLDQLWQEYEAFERGQSEALAQALISDFAPKYQNARTCYLERNRVYSSADLQLGRLATVPVDESDEDHATKIEEEYALLKLWKTRCSYERTNPLRLESHELSRRVRSTFKEMVCVLTRHPEPWHMWSTWELSGSENRKVEKSINVLQLGQKIIPDSTLLALAESQVIELHTDHKANCLNVMQQFVDRCPTTLGYVLYQQMVRRYRGKDEARTVFARARRILSSDINDSDTANVKIKMEPNGEHGEAERAEKEKLSKKEDIGLIRRIVTNRLDASVGLSGQSTKADQTFLRENGNQGNKLDSTHSAAPAGRITWHLYASHATMEHRVNKCADVAARVYELGLRKHSSFITIPPYVMRYAHLLLELNDVMNLRALLTRSVAACEIIDNRWSLAAMWDMNLHFESIIASSDPSYVANIHAIEKRRREALMGPEIEDVGTGGFVGVDETALVGAQKTTLSELLIRSEGYDMSSRIVNGLGRAVDVLGVMGLWGDIDFELSRNRMRAKYMKSNKENEEFACGGRSDTSYQKRLMYHLQVHSGLSTESSILDSTVAGAKMLSARERLQHGAAASATGPGQGTAILLAIQQSPEWLRPLLLLLPASKLRLPIVAKPPPHLTEMALSTLRQNALPLERPAESAADSSKRALSGGDGNSSDDDDDVKAGGSGYSNAFRARQRIRISQNGSNPY